MFQQVGDTCNLFGLFVEDNSMPPFFQRGDVVICDPDVAVCGGDFVHDFPIVSIRSKKKGFVIGRGTQHIRAI